MEKKSLAIEAAAAVSGVTIIPVTETSVYGWGKAGGISFLGIKKPLYILILKPGSVSRVFDMGGNETSPGLIMANYPEMRERLQGLIPDYQL